MSNTTPEGKKTAEYALKRHTQINKIQLTDPHWNAGIPNGIRTSGHFVLFEDAVHAVLGFAALTSSDKDAEIAELKKQFEELQSDRDNLRTNLIAAEGEMANEKRLRESCEKALEEREREIARLNKEKEDSQKFQKESRIKRKAEMRALESENKALVEALDELYKEALCDRETHGIAKDIQRILSTVSKEKEG